MYRKIYKVVVLAILILFGFAAGTLILGAAFLPMEDEELYL